MSCIVFVCKNLCHVAYLNIQEHKTDSLDFLIEGDETFIHLIYAQQHIPIKGKPTVRLNDLYQDSYDEYAEYEDQFNPLNNDRQARRKRKPKIKHIPKKTETEIIEEIAAASGVEGIDFVTTYQPSKYEAEWLLSSLIDFYNRDLIADVLAQVKGGKEASVYVCEAHASTGKATVAAKVYRPKKFRSLKNDQMYREGRTILTEDGKALKERDLRAIQAVIKGDTSFGQQTAHTSWLMHEFTTLQTLYNAGAAVPEPIASSSNALLMGYIGEDVSAAHTLSEIQIDEDEADELFQEVMRNVELFLQHGLAHGDLSAYNILYWEGEITIIDFPQVINIENNPQAGFILQRDIKRVCDYFAKHGVKCNADQIFVELWTKYVGDVEPDLIDYDLHEENTFNDDD